MLEANEIARWNHTASLMACVVGMVKKGVGPLDFHPYLRSEARGLKATAENLRGLKSAFSEWVG